MITIIAMLTLIKMPTTVITIMKLILFTIIVKAVYTVIHMADTLLTLIVIIPSATTTYLYIFFFK